MARPNKYYELNIKDKLDSVRGWAMNGSTDEEIAKMLGVSLSTIYEWKKQFLEFSEAIKKGKEIANGELINSAFKQATGYYVTEQQAIKVKVAKDKEEIEIVEVEKYMPPNPTMNIFMLKNRLPEHYRDKPPEEKNDFDNFIDEVEGDG